MQFIINYNLTGILIGICTFLTIGLFHPIVIKFEYYIGVKHWYILAILGIIAAVVSILSTHQIISPIAGVFAFSSFWSIKELFEQEERVKKGWFPKNNKRL